VWRSFRKDDSGFTIIEVLVAALVVASLAAATLYAYGGASKASGAQRSHSQASAVAQQEQETLRSQSPTTLATYVATPHTASFTSAGTTFSTSTSAAWVDETTGGAACTGSANITRYLRLTTTVTWTAPGGTKTYVSRGLVGVPSGGGRLVAQVYDRNKDPESGVTFTVTPPSGPNFSATTGAAGCAEWDYLTPGTYTVAISRPTGGNGWVDKTGNPAPTQTATVTDGLLNTVSFDFDQSATLTTRFYTQYAAVMAPWCPGPSLPCPINYAPANSGSDRITVSNASMGANRIFGVAGTDAATRTTSGDGAPVSPGLFPFTTPYTLYPGLCVPTGGVYPAGLSISATPAPGSNTTVDMRMAEFDINATYRTTSGGAYVAANGARIVLDRQGGASGGGCPAVRLPDRTTNSTGDMPFSGVPAGYYDVCAQLTVSGATYRVNPAGTADVRDFTAPASYVFQIDARAGGSPTGPCP
jgi:prepilin-type N-terminal cleavage/methylation domain-containing protein